MMNINTLKLIFFICVLSSCSTKEPDNQDNELIDNDFVLKSDTLITKEREKQNHYKIYSYYPDSLTREKLIQLNGGEESYQTIVDDNLYSTLDILKYIDSLKLEAIAIDDPYFVIGRDTIDRKRFKNPNFGMFVVKENGKIIELNIDNYKRIIK